MLSGSYYRGYNIDGWYSRSIQLNQSLQVVYSYIQYFRNGIVEIVDSMDSWRAKGNKIMKAWSQYEIDIYKKLEVVSDLLSKAGAPKPWYIYISFLNAKGYITDNDFYTGLEVDRNYLQAMEGIWQEEKMTLEEVMLPVFNSLANVFNKETSLLFEPD